MFFHSATGSTGIKWNNSWVERAGKAIPTAIHRQSTWPTSTDIGNSKLRPPEPEVKNYTWTKELQATPTLLTMPDSGLAHVDMARRLHMSRDICYVKCQCQMPRHVTFTCHVSHDSWHMLPCHITSRVTCHMSRVTWDISIFFDTWQYVMRHVAHYNCMQHVAYDIDKWHT